MGAKIKKKLKQLFCRHKTCDVVCWHWVHSDNGHGPRIIELQNKCDKCGKYFISYIYHMENCEKFSSVFKNKEWSEICKPVGIFDNIGSDKL